MRMELVPVLLGLLAVGMGIALVVDAAVPDGTFIAVERRRGQRPPRNSIGEGLLGASIILLGASLIGRDSWPYTTLSVLLAVVLGVVGVAMNWHYLREMAVASEYRSDESSLQTEGEVSPAEARDRLTSDEQSSASLS